MTCRTTTALASKALSASDAVLPRRLTRLALVLTTALTPVWGAADTLPTGGSVVSGTATIGTPNAGTLNIDQSSNRAVVDWNRFSIGQGNTVNINQPSADAAILNRVTGNTTSQIHGQLNANGRVFVVNPNGIFIGATGAVRAGGFVASTLGIRNDDFMQGQTVFEGDGSSATVSNAGNIEVVTGGYAALIGGQVSNSGTIQAPLGFVGLGSGERITLDLGGDGFMQVAIPTDSDDPAMQALIENSGTIQANGGTVQMSAATARHAARHAINMSGVVEARTVSGRNGRITLGGGGGGTVSVSGKVRTKARRPAIQVTQSARPAVRPERGGDITITGRDIRLSGADIDASGTDGGGNIRIGGNLQGGAGLPTADVLTVDAGTVINADATRTGDGGRVIAWSDLETNFAGNISVRGGDQSGDGGFAEVSGKVNLAYTGFTDALAPNGETGELLLDPADIEIVQTAPALNQINNTALEGQLAGANVTIATSGANLPSGFIESGGDTGIITIVTTAPLSWSSGNTLELIADDDIIVNSTVTPGAGGGLILDAADRVIINGTIQGADSTLEFFGGTDVTVAGSGTINGTDATILLDSLVDINIDGDIAAPGSTTELIALNDIAVGSFASINTLGGALTLDASGVGISGAVDVDLTTVDADLFRIGADANWIQNNATLGVFDATNFVIELGGTFQRVLGGDGGTSPFLLSDVYGLQGAPTVNASGSGFALANDIDASPATSWASLDAPVNGVTDSGFVPFSFSSILDGQDFSITGLNVSRHSQTTGSSLGGLFSVNNGTVRNLAFINANINAPQAGIVAGSNLGLIEQVSVSGTVRAHSTPGEDPIGGGIVGVNESFGSGPSGTIRNSSATAVALLAIPDPSFAIPGDADTLSLGGIAGVNNGTIDQTDSSFGNIATSLTMSGDAGGIAGINTGSISNSYVTSSVSVDTGSGGSIAGTNFGSISNTLGNGSVSVTTGNAGGLVGLDDPSPFNISSSYFNTGTTGQTVSGQNGEVDAGTPGSFQGARAETTASLQDAQAFFDDADDAGWDFLTVWSLPLNGADQARLYTNDAVISAFGPATGPAFSYNGNTTGFTVGGTIAGGPLINGPNLNDTGDPSILNDQITLSGADVGPVTYTFPSTFTSDQMVPYSVRQLVNNATIEPAPMTIFVNDATKVYGDPFTFADVSFTEVDTFFGSDGITSATVDSLGAPVTAEVQGGTPYDLTLINFVGTGLNNYLLQVNTADLTVTPRNLTIDVDNASKPIGTALTFNGTEFSTTGLVNLDTVDTLTLTSSGAPASASIAGSPYDIDGSNPIGTGLDNYNITINPGLLTINGMLLNVFLNNASKTYGNAISFNGTEFTTSGLQPGDTLTSLTISSAGASAGAPVGSGSYAITGSNPVGTGLQNYTLNITPGILTVAPAPLTITANDQTKRGGTEFTFTGNEFTVSGLLNADTVTSATLSSDAAAIDAPVTGAAGAAILITNANGVGLDNYTISFVGGVFVVAPGDLVITANDITKIYGTELTLDGSEFTVTGLAEGDSVDSVTLVSAGTAATAQVGDSPYTIMLSDPVGSGLDAYELVFADGSLTIVQAPLTVTALDQTKVQGQAFTFAGTEFTASGLLNGDSLDSATITSAGADAGALAEDGPFAITVDSFVGTGLGNYDIASVAGTFTVDGVIDTITPPQLNPVGGGNSTLPNPADPITIAFPGNSGTDLGAVQERGGQSGGGAQQSPADASDALVAVESVSGDLEAAIQTCGNADQDFTNYMACLSESLDTYANALDQISNDLPAGFENVSAVIQNARVGVDAAAARATRRLATASSDAERQSIRRDAINEARGAIDEAKTEIRKAISLIRADDPEVAAIQRDTGARIVQAFDTVDSELVRAVEL